MPLMLSVANKLIVLSVIMLSVVMLNIVAPVYLLANTLHYVGREEVFI